jgi:hypothetical protein
MVYLYKDMTYLKKIGLLLGVCGICATVLITAFPHKAAAAGALATDFGLSVSNNKANISPDNFSLTWIDAAHLELKFTNGQIMTFVPGGIQDNGQTDLKDERLSSEQGAGVEFTDKDFACDNKITFDINENDSDNEKAGKTLQDATVDIDFIPGVGSECEDTNPNSVHKAAADPQMSIAYFGWVDAGRIQMVDGQNPGLFTRAADGSNIYWRDDEPEGTECRDKMILDPAANTVRWYELDKSYSGSPPADVLAGGGCKYRESSSFPPSNKAWPLAWTVPNRAKPAGTGQTSIDPNADAGSSPIELNCDFKIYNPLSWFMCPLIEGASGAITALDSAINGQLTISISTYFDESNSDSGARLYQAWAVMRSMALALLVVIALIMVISQAISSGPFDAYTVKKVLPRIVLAVIAATLSWQICKLLISISNDLGQGIGTIISAPFAGLKQPSINGGAIGGGIGAIGAIAGFFSGIDILVILSFVLTGLAALLIAFAVIAFRNILVILLVITAPAALIFWILPNTQKAWKFWKDNFGAVLLAFPIIVAFITAGKIFALITSNAPGNGLFRDVIIFIAYFGPYFALPAAFRLAGGAIASIGGVVNDRSKGFFDRNKKFRSEEKGRARKQRTSGNTFKNVPEGSLRSRFNKGVEFASNAQKGRFNRAGIQSALSKNNYHEAKELLDKNESMAAIKGNEDYLEAGRVANDVVRDKAGNEVKDASGATIRRDGSERAAKAYLEARNYAGRDVSQAVASILQVKREASQEAFNIAAVLGTPSTGTGFGGGAGEMDRAIAEATGGDTLMASRMLAEMRGTASAARRPDLAGGSYGNRLEAYKEVRNAMMVPGATEASVQAAMQKVTQQIDRETLYTQSGGAIATMKAGQYRERIAPMMLGDLKSTIANGDTTAVLRQLGAIEGRHDVANQIGPENAQVLADEVLSQQIDVSTLSNEMRQILAPAINEYTASTDAAGNRTVTQTGTKQYITVQQMGEAMQGNAVYREARKEFGSAQEANQQRGPGVDPGAIPPVLGT